MDLLAPQLASLAKRIVNIAPERKKGWQLLDGQPLVIPSNLWWR
jgi:hypothetical protein